MGGTKKKKGEVGAAATYMTRQQALKRLQLSLKDFRRLCILKGIYPRAPKKKPHGPTKTYYLTKDIQFLSHEPIVDKFRQLKSHLKRVRKLIGRGQTDLARDIDKSSRPKITLLHVVKERYPTFIDAVRDMDDALTLVHTFAHMPASHTVPAQRIENCRRLCREFQHYVIRSKGLRKVFLSIKGIYYQADVLGQPVTWLTTYNYAHQPPTDVDFRVMSSFLEFYETFLHFINLKLYRSLNLQYPPQIDLASDESGLWLGALRVAAAVEGAALPKAAPSRSISDAEKRRAEAKALEAASASKPDASGDDGDEDDEDSESDAVGEGFDDENARRIREETREREAFENLFRGLRIFLGRETPLASLEFVLTCLGAEIGWQGTGSPIEESDPQITHQVTDRPKVQRVIEGRDYVQPQWVYDCINARIRLPVNRYAPGEILPPHLSPFVDDEEEGYIPAERKYVQALAQGEAAEMAEESDSDGEGQKNAGIGVKALPSEPAADASDSEDEAPRPAGKKRHSKEAEEKELAMMMMTNKKRRLYNRMMHGIDRKKGEVENLKQKRLLAFVPLPLLISRAIKNQKQSR